MKQCLFLGQAPARPSSKHEIPGAYLHAWLHSIGLSDQAIKKHCHFYALTDIFPGSSRYGHLAPTPEQVAAHRPALLWAITSLQPDVIVPVGKMAIAELLHNNDPLERIIGSQYELDPLDALGYPIACIPLPHPSGRSVWSHTHPDHVATALELLKAEIDG